MEMFMNNSNQRSHELLVAFRDGYLGQPLTQLGGVQGILSTYLEYFLSPKIAEVFYANEPTPPMYQIDAGRTLTNGSGVPKNLRYHESMALSLLPPEGSHVAGDLFSSRSDVGLLEDNAAFFRSFNPTCVGTGTKPALAPAHRCGGASHSLAHLSTRRSSHGY